MDAGTFGTMGVGLGFAIAAAVLVKYEDENLDPPASHVVCIQGDSAFGFSGMELETVFRLVLSCIINTMLKIFVICFMTQRDRVRIQSFRTFQTTLNINYKAIASLHCL